MIETHRRNLKEQLVAKLARFDAFVGEVAWISDPVVLEAMAGKCLGLVTQRRPISERLWARYQRALAPVTPETIVGLGRRPRGLGEVRLRGTHHDWGSGFRRGSGPNVFMHRKILVLGDMEACSPYWWGGEGPVHWVFRPRAIWTGSYNMTVASRRHHEHVVYIEDDAVAEKAAAEFYAAYTAA